MDGVFVEGVQHIAVFIQPCLCALYHKIIRIFNGDSEVIRQCLRRANGFIYVIPECIFQQHGVFRCFLQFVTHQFCLLIGYRHCVGSVFHIAAEVVLVHILGDVLHFF